MAISSGNTMFQGGVPHAALEQPPCNKHCHCKIAPHLDHNSTCGPPETLNKTFPSATLSKTFAALLQKTFYLPVMTMVITTEAPKLAVMWGFGTSGDNESVVV